MSQRAAAVPRDSRPRGGQRLARISTASSFSSSRRDFTMPHFRVTYVVSAPDEAGAREIVDALCLEQTVELPLALVPPGTWINEHVVAKCESLRRRLHQPVKPSEPGDTRWDAVVRYNDDTSGNELPQLLNVIFGNTSIKENVMVDDLVLSSALLGKFLGPRFGTAGLREVLGVMKGPLLMTALKPMGTCVAKLAEMAYHFAKGGIDVIKDDHGLANQKYAPFEDRVRACCAAVKKANLETGRNCVYAPCLNAPAHLVVSRARFAKACGAGAVLMIPGITGLDSTRLLAEDPTFGLPIICHPAILGAMLGGGSEGTYLLLKSRHTVCPTRLTLSFICLRNLPRVFAQSATRRAASALWVRRDDLPVVRREVRVFGERVRRYPGRRAAADGQLAANFAVPRGRHDHGENKNHVRGVRRGRLLFNRRVVNRTLP